MFTDGDRRSEELLHRARLRPGWPAQALTGRPGLTGLARGASMGKRASARQGAHMTTVAARPFSLHVPEPVLQDLRARLAAVRWPDEAPGAPWSYGTSVAYLQGLVDHWRHRFDWRTQEARLN